MSRGRPTLTDNSLAISVCSQVSSKYRLQAVHRSVVYECNHLRPFEDRTLFPARNHARSSVSSILSRTSQFRKSMATNGDGPRMSLALWAEALVANRVQAAMAARYLRVLCMSAPSKRV